MIEEKIKKIERISKEKQRNMDHYEKIEDKNKRLKDKLWDLEDRSHRNNLCFDGLKDKLWDLDDRSHRNNLCFDGVREYENESWNDREEVLKDFLFENLGLRNIKIERAHRTGERKEDTSRTIDGVIWPKNWY